MGNVRIFMSFDQILQNQIVTTLRNARPLEIPERYKRP
jgi:hypothetical protein